MREWWLIPGDARALRYADRCACCDAATPDRWDVVPYCSACRAHLRWHGNGLVVASTLAAGLGATYAMRTLAPFASLIVHLAAVVATLVAVGSAWLMVRRRHRVGAPHACADQAAEITPDGLLARSRAWAERVATDNSVVVRRTEASRFAVIEQLLPFGAAALGVAAVIAWFPHWHQQLWIDNGSAATATVRADGHAIAEVGAGETTRIDVPLVPLAITTDAGDDDRLDPAHGTQWILNIGRHHCYELRESGYAPGGSGVYFGSPPKPYAARLFPIEADYIFTGFPDTIVVDTPQQAHPLAERRSALAIVPCPGTHGP